MQDRYIYHITTDARHARKILHSEISESIITHLRPLLEDMINGESCSIVDAHYYCRVGKHSGKMIEFIISRFNDDLKQVDLIRFVVCSHSRKKNVAWALVDGFGNAPEVPFCAVQLLTDNMTPEDISYIPMFTDFECSIAWTWLKMLQNKKEVQ